MEIKSEQFRIENFDQAIHGASEAFRVHFFRQVADDGAFAIVRDAHAVAEHREQRLLAGHEVGLQQVFTNRVTGIDLQSFVNPGVLIDERFVLDENRTQFAVGRERGDSGFVNIPVVGAEPIEDLSDDCGIDCGVKFVGFHCGKRMMGRPVNRFAGAVARAESDKFPLDGRIETQRRGDCSGFRGKNG